MSKATVMICGEAGTGKTQCFFKNKQLDINGLNPAETFIISLQKNELPMRGWRKHFTPFGKDNPKGNFLISDNISVITNIIKYINASRPDIKYLIIDDFTYLIANEYMRRNKEKSYDKFLDIGHMAFTLLNQCIKETRDDMYVFITAHSEPQVDPITGMPVASIKTIGKMLSEKYNIAGLFNYLLFSSSEMLDTNEGQRINKYFITNSDGTTMAKTPQGVFNTIKIPNDAAYIIKCIEDYENGDDE